jgi:hypothetical protein
MCVAGDLPMCVYLYWYRKPFLLLAPKTGHESGEWSECVSVCVSEGCCCTIAIL